MRKKNVKKPRNIILLSLFQRLIPLKFQKFPLISFSTEGMAGKGTTKESGNVTEEEGLIKIIMTIENIEEIGLRKGK